MITINVGKILKYLFTKHYGVILLLRDQKFCFSDRIPSSFCKVIRQSIKKIGDSKDGEKEIFRE